MQRLIKNEIKTLTIALLIVFGLQVRFAQAQTSTQIKIEEAMSAAPPSISANATILDYPSEPRGKRSFCAKVPMNEHVSPTIPTCLVKIPSVLTLR